MDASERGLPRPIPLTPMQSAAQERRRYRMWNGALAGLIVAALMGLLVFGIGRFVLLVPSTVVRAITAVLIVCAEGVVIAWAVRAAIFGVVVDEAGATTLGWTWSIKKIHLPWAQIERFAVYYDLIAWGGRDRPCVLESADPSRSPGYGACAVLRDGRTVRLKGISAAGVGTQTRQQVDSIVAALNEHLAAEANSRERATVAPQSRHSRPRSRAVLTPLERFTAEHQPGDLQANQAKLTPQRLASNPGSGISGPSHCRSRGRQNACRPRTGAREAQSTIRAALADARAPSVAARRE